MYKRAEASFWTAEEVDLAQDKDDYDNLDQGTRHWIELVLAQFSQADAIVSENLVENFCQEVQPQEFKFWFSMQNTIENVHTECYSLLIDTYVRDDAKKEKLLDAITHYPSVKRKAEWCFKYMNRERNAFAARLIAFACCEMIFFSSSFCAIFHIKKLEKLPGLCFSNELISRDEALHCEFGCLLYSMLQQKLPEEMVHTIIKDSVDVECQFVKEALPERTTLAGKEMVSMSQDDMIQYVKYVADLLCRMLQVSPIYYVSNPFDWMTAQSMTSFQKHNYFECKVSNYQVPLHKTSRQEAMENLDQVDF